MTRIRNAVVCWLLGFVGILGIIQARFAFGQQDGVSLGWQIADALCGTLIAAAAAYAIWRLTTRPQVPAAG